MSHERYIKYTKKNREERKKAGLCRCGGQPVDGHQRCQKCIDDIQSRRVRRRYGITLEEYIQFFRDPICKICGSTENLELDHDHTTGKPRACLCHLCNTGLGMFREDVRLLAKAIEYITSRKNL